MTKSEIIQKLITYSQLKTKENDYGYLGGILNSDGTLGKVPLKHFRQTRVYAKGKNVYLFPYNGFRDVFYLLKGLKITAPNFSAAKPWEEIGGTNEKKSAYIKISSSSFNKIKTLFA